MSTARLLVLIVALGTLGCAPKTALLVDAKQHPDATYYFSTLSKRQARAVERLVPPGGVVTRQAKTKRQWLYIIDDPGVGEGLPRFEFAPLQKCEIEVDLERLSDLSGRGVDARDVRRRDSFKREFEGEGMVEAIGLLQALALNPFDAAKAQAPQAWEAVAQPTQVDATEVGFVVSATARLVTGNPFDPTSRITLYTLEARSPYQRARDAEASP